MENLEYTFGPGPVPAGRAHVGVVASGDLEILLTPGDGDGARVRVRTSTDGFGEIWSAVLTRWFDRYPISADIEINDFGATPGMVTLRLAQLAEQAAGEGEQR